MDWARFIVLAPGCSLGGPPVATLLLLGLEPGVLHRRDPAVCELQGIVRQELDLVVAEEEDEPLGDVPGDFDIREVITPEQLGVASNFKVVLIDVENHPDPGVPVPRRTYRSFELHFFLNPPASPYRQVPGAGKAV
jgi:hypothetical protein